MPPESVQASKTPAPLIGNSGVSASFWQFALNWVLRLLIRHGIGNSGVTASFGQKYLKTSNGLSPNTPENKQRRRPWSQLAPQLISWVLRPLKIMFRHG